MAAASPAIVLTDPAFQRGILILEQLLGNINTETDPLIAELPESA